MPTMGIELSRRDDNSYKVKKKNELHKRDPPQKRNKSVFVPLPPKKDKSVFVYFTVYSRPTLEFSDPSDLQRLRFILVRLWISIFNK